MPRQTTKAKQDVIKLHQENLTLSQISKTLNTPKTTCFNFIRRFEARGHHNNKKTHVDLNNWTKEKKDGSSGCLSEIRRKIRRNFWVTYSQKRVFYQSHSKDIDTVGITGQNCYEKTTFDHNESTFQKRVGNQ